jgi:hypothetical protein
MLYKTSASGEQLHQLFRLLNLEGEALEEAAPDDRG